MFDCQSTTAKISRNSNFLFLTCSLKLSKQPVVPHIVVVSQNWSTKVHANKTTTNRALKKELNAVYQKFSDSCAKPRLKNFIKRMQVSQQRRGGHLTDALYHFIFPTCLFLDKIKISVFKKKTSSI